MVEVVAPSGAERIEQRSANPTVRGPAAAGPVARSYANGRWRAARN